MCAPNGGQRCYGDGPPDCLHCNCYNGLLGHRLRAWRVLLLHRCPGSAAHVVTVADRMALLLSAAASVDSWGFSATRPGKTTTFCARPPLSPYFRSRRPPPPVQSRVASRSSLPGNFIFFLVVRFSLVRQILAIYSAYPVPRPYRENLNQINVERGFQVNFFINFQPDFGFGFWRFLITRP